jgi:Tfp pilus assembly protein PilO
VFIGVLVAIPLGAWWLVFRPHNLREAEMRKQLEAKQAKLQALNRATGTIGNLKREILALQKGLQFFQSKLPSEKEMDKVLREVWRLAEASRLTTKSIRTQKRTGRSRYTGEGHNAHEQPIEMRLEGNFLGFYTFLQALENQPRIMRIHKMELETKNDGPQGHVQATFVVSVFFEPSAGPAPAPGEKST